VHISNRDINPGYVGAMHCCKAPPWGRRLDLDSPNLTPRFGMPCPCFAIWRQAAASRILWRQICGQSTTPQPGFMSRFAIIYTVYLLCYGFNNEDERQSPPYRDPALHFHAPRLIALRGGDRNEETPKTDNKGGVLMRRACARTPSRATFCCWSAAFSPHPARSADWRRVPCLAIAPCIPESNS
jgi:hypothetical protein